MVADERFLQFDNIDMEKPDILSRCTWLRAGVQG